MSVYTMLATSTCQEISDRTNYSAKKNGDWVTWVKGVIQRERERKMKGTA